MNKRVFSIFAILTGILLVLAACGGQAATEAPVVEPPTEAPAVEQPTEAPAPTEEPVVLPAPENPGDVVVQAVYDGDQIALRFTWMSTKEYAGQFHDFVQFKEGEWNRLPSAERVEEDRIALMIDNPQQPVPGFTTMGCYVACHSDLVNMPGQLLDADGNKVEADHYVLAPEGAEAGAYALDMWHWRGGRSGVMGYAEDTWVSTGLFEAGALGRQRDNASGPTNWLREKGDRLREDQTWGGDVLVWKDTLLPRFVFNPAKSGFNNYFLADANGNAFTDVQVLLASIEDITYRSNLIVYQDLAFDPIDKVNSIDIMYLLVTAGAVEAPEYNSDWAAYWAAQTGVADAAAAEAMLDDIASKMADGVMVTRAVNFIFPSSQHDVSSTRDFDYENNIWTVTLIRDLTTATVGVDDVDFASLASGVKFPFAFAVHDIGKGSQTHFISFPYALGNESTDADVVAIMVDSISSVDWTLVPTFQTKVFAPPTTHAYENLLDKGFHMGADRMEERNCQACHAIDLEKGPVEKP